MKNPYDIIENNQAHNGWARCFKEMNVYLKAINKIRETYNNDELDEIDRDLFVYKILEEIDEWEGKRYGKNNKN